MHQEEVKALFDRKAAEYDARWSKTAPIQSCLHLLVDAMFAKLPDDARILCVGAGTGLEMAYLAKKHPGWHFTAVDPSPRMLDVCRQRAEREGFDGRCRFHLGYVETLKAGRYDAATCFLVSQFILDVDARAKFFREIANKLTPSGLLASSDLTFDTGSSDYERMLPAWLNMMSSADLSSQDVERLRDTYANDVGILPPGRVESIIKAGGFESPMPFFQAGLIQAWLSIRKSTLTD